MLPKGQIKKTKNRSLRGDSIYDNMIIVEEVESTTIVRVDSLGIHCQIYYRNGSSHQVTLTRDFIDKNLITTLSESDKRKYGFSGRINYVK